MRRLILFLLLLSSALTYSQTELDSAGLKDLKSYEFAGVFRSALSANFGGVSGVIGITYDVLLSEHWGFEVGGGYPGAGFGFTYCPFKVERSKGKFHISQRNLIFGRAFGDQAKVQYGLCIGITQFGTKRWNWGIDVGPMYEHTINSFDQITPENGPVSFMFNFKAGYRFSFKYMKRKKELMKE
jgi:hypothetical protein